MVNIDGELAVVKGPDKAWVEEIGRWLDPHTNQLNPCKWKIHAITDKGRLDAVVTAYGRAYYQWIRMGGTLVVHQFLADAEATFTRTDGTVITSKQKGGCSHIEPRIELIVYSLPGVHANVLQAGPSRVRSQRRVNFPGTIIFVSFVGRMESEQWSVYTTSEYECSPDHPFCSM